MWMFLLIGCTSDGLFDGLNLFTVEEDIEFGEQLRDEIAANPDDFPILDESSYPEAYDHIYRIRDSILNSSEVTHADTFAWETYIIHDDDVLNAFCAPGGFIYVYTGLINYLEYEDELAGVMGHEIAHADRRHSTQQLTQIYGLSMMMEVILGTNTSSAAEIAAGLVNLSFSRDHETDADEYSVRYLCETEYAADGAAGFFAKLLEEEGISIPEFISTHPSSDDRVEEIANWAEVLGCSVEYNPESDYEAVLSSLP